MTPSLHALIDEAAVFDAEYRHGLSNHLPMALFALHRLGADEERLRGFFAAYSARLQPARAAEPWPAGDAWQSRLGDPAAWPAYRGLFALWLQLEGAGEVLQQVLPTLMRGCGAAAFHGLIRVAYAVQARHRGELADALAYWACRWLDLCPPRQTGDDPDVEGLLRRLPQHRGQPGGTLIFQAMRAAARARGFAPVVDALRVDAETLPQLARLAAMGYAASGNFTLLHLVTSACAVRVLQPWLEADSSIACYWRAFAAAVSAAGIRTLPPVAQLPWPELAAAAIASQDDHLIKLVDSCHEQQAALGDGPWRAAASRAVAAAASA